MQKHLFLTGPTGSGKSALLRRALGIRLDQAGGFVTEATWSVSGELTGFTLSPAAAACGSSSYPAELFLDCRCFPPRTDNEVFRRTGVRLLREAVWYPYVLLDEFGGFELILPEFRSALMELLSSDRPIIGALRREEEAEALRRALGLGEKYSRISRQLRDFLSQNENTLLVQTDGTEKAAAQDAVLHWIREYLE